MRSMTCYARSMHSRLIALGLIAFLHASTSFAATLSPEILMGKVGYLRVPDLSKDTAKFLRPAFQDLNKLKPIGTVLDLRGNTGGGIDGIHAIVESFLPAGTPYMKVFIPNRTLKVTRLMPVLRKSLPLIVLIDERTNNEAMIVASILQKIRRAPVVAEVSSRTSPYREYAEHARMGTYGPVQSGSFTVVPDVRIVKETSRLPAGNLDGALNRAVKMVKDLSPWAR